MIIKGVTHNNGAKLGRYMITGKAGERVELWQLRGFADEDIVLAFLSVHVMADATQCEQPFFHVQVRNPVGDRALSREEWERIADRIEAKIGYEGQGRAIAFHVDEASGQEHMHVAWNRIDDALKAIPLPFYKLRLKEVAREIEEEFGLTRVKNERAPHAPRAAKRNESEQSRRLRVDGRAIRQTIQDIYERSPDGGSLRHGLDAAGMILARGDRRDFVVVDRAGGAHALNGRLLAATARQVAERLADLDPAMLPSVAEARARQALRFGRSYRGERRPRRDGGGE